MAATTDIRLDRIRHEYTGLRDTQDALMDRIDSYEAALLGLNEMVTENRERLERVEEVVAENRAILLAIAERLDVTYEKPPAGFVKE